MSTAPVPTPQKNPPTFASPDEPGTPMVVDRDAKATSTMDSATPPPPMEDPIVGLKQRVAIVPIRVWGDMRLEASAAILRLVPTDMEEAVERAKAFNAAEKLVTYEWR